jgi:hypothetical protein
MKYSRTQFRRYIAVYSNGTDEMVNRHDLAAFELSTFQDRFVDGDRLNKMYDCYVIDEKDARFLVPYLQCVPKWDFVEFSYYLESEAE